MQSGSGSGLTTLLLFALPVLLLVFMFTSQRKRAKQIEQLQAGLAVGDEVVLTSGIYGTVAALDGPVAMVEVADGIVLRVDRRAVGMTAAEVAPGRGAARDSYTDSGPDAAPDDPYDPDAGDGTGRPGGR